MVKLQVQKKPLKKPRKIKLSQKQKQEQNVTVNINKASRTTPRSQAIESKVIQRAPHATAPTSYTNLSFSQPASNNNSSLMLRELFSVNRELEKKINQLEKAQPRSNFEKKLASEYSQANQQLDEQDVTNEYTIIDQPQARAQRAQQERVIRRTVPDNPLLRGLRDVVGESYQVAPSGVFRDQLEATLGPNQLPFVTSSSAPRSGIGSLNQVTNISKEGRLENTAYRQQAQTETRPRAVAQPALKEPYNSVEASLRRAESDGLPSEGTPILERFEQAAEEHSNEPELEAGQGVETYAEAPDRRADGQDVLGGAQETPNRLEAYIAEYATTGSLLEEQRGEEVAQLAPIAKQYAAEADEDGEDDKTEEGLGAALSGASAATENIFTPPKQGTTITAALKEKSKPNANRDALAALARGAGIPYQSPHPITGKPVYFKQESIIAALTAAGVDVSPVTSARKK